MSVHSHTVQFYRDDIFLSQSIAPFVTAGLEANETVIIVARHTIVKSFSGY